MRHSVTLEPATSVEQAILPSTANRQETLCCIVSPSAILQLLSSNHSSQYCGILIPRVQAIFHTVRYKRLLQCMCVSSCFQTSRGADCP